MIAASVRCRRFIGRRRESEFLIARRRDLARGHGGIVLVRGDAGIGKSRLLREFLEATGNARGRVAAGRCRPYASRPYEALLDVLEGFGSPAAALIPAASQDEQRRRIVDALLDCSSRHACVAVVEDLHWADRETVGALAQLAERIATRRLLVVATYRGHDVHDDHPLLGAIGALRRERAVAEIELEPLARGETARFIEAALEGAGELPAEVRLAVATVAEGNPFFIEELLCSALDRVGTRRAERPWPETVRAAIGERLAHLDAADRAILAHAAVIGRYFDVDLLADALGTESAALLPALARARALQILEETSDPATFAFRHAITREVTYEEQLAARRRPLHRRIATAIEAHGVNDRTLGALAYHWSAAGDREKALVYGERAGDDAQSVHEYDGAIACYERTLALLDPRGADALRVTTKIASSFFRSGRMDHATAWYRTAWRSLPQPDADAAFVFRLARDLASALFNDGRPHEALDFWNEAIGVLVAAGDVAVADLARASYATFLADAGRIAETAAVLAAIAPESLEAEPRTALAFSSASCVLSARRGDVGALRAAADGLCALGERLARTVLTSNDIGEAGMAALYCGVTEVSKRCMQLAVDNALAFNASPVTVCDLLLARAIVHEACGEYVTARAAFDRARTTLADMKLDQFFFAQTALALGLAQNDAQLLACAPDRRLLDEAIATGKAPIFGPLAAFWARFLAARGALDDARAVALRAVDAALASGDAFGSFPLALSAAAVCAPPHARRVLELCARDGTGPAPAATRSLAAAVLARRFASGDPVPDARRAAEGFAAVGWPLYEAAARELAGDPAGARAARERIGYRGEAIVPAGAEPIAASDDPFGGALTARELTIARLVAGGSTNREVALALHVSVKLVEKHLSAVFRKLGLRTRGQLAARFAAAGGERPVVE